MRRNEEDKEAVMMPKRMKGEGIQESRDNQHQVQEVEQSKDERCLPT